MNDRKCEYCIKEDVCMIKGSDKKVIGCGHFTGIEPQGKTGDKYIHEKCKTCRNCRCFDWCGDEGKIGRTIHCDKWEADNQQSTSEYDIKKDIEYLSIFFQGVDDLKAHQSYLRVIAKIIENKAALQKSQEDIRIDMNSIIKQNEEYNKMTHFSAFYDGEDISFRADIFENRFKDAIDLAYKSALQKSQKERESLEEYCDTCGGTSKIENCDPIPHEDPCHNEYCRNGRVPLGVNDLLSKNCDLEDKAKQLEQQILEEREIQQVKKAKFYDKLQTKNNQIELMKYCINCKDHMVESNNCLHNTKDGECCGNWTLRITIER